jgi:hypothetical protein
MEKFQIRYFRGTALEKVEALEAPDLLEVIDRASQPAAGVTAEIWSRVGKVGVIGPMPNRVGDSTESTPDAQIAELMKTRLRLVRG